MDQIKIGKFIQQKRKERKLTQSDLAEKLNISDRTISKWENGDNLPDLETLNELCKFYGVTLDYLTPINNKVNSNRIFQKGKININIKCTQFPFIINVFFISIFFSDILV